MPGVQLLLKNNKYLLLERERKREKEEKYYLLNAWPFSSPIEGGEKNNGDPR